MSENDKNINQVNGDIQLFENKRIRSAWNDTLQEWYFSVIGVLAVLTDQKTQRSARTIGLN